MISKLIHSNCFLHKFIFCLLPVISGFISAYVIKQREAYEHLKPYSIGGDVMF